MANEVMDSVTGNEIVTEINSSLKSEIELRESELKNEEELQKKRLENAKKLALLNKKEAKEAAKDYLQGMLAAMKTEHDKRLVDLKTELEAKSEAADAKYGEGSKKAADVKKKLQIEYDERVARENKLFKLKTNWEEKEENKRLRRAQAANAKEAREATGGNLKSALDAMKSTTATFGDMASKLDSMSDGFKEIFSESGGGAKGALAGLTATLAGLADSLDTEIEDIASKKGVIDTALQGSKQNKVVGSYWGALSRDITGIAGVSPLVKQSDIVSNLTSMVTRGIAFNLEERATLESIKTKIAGTFSSTNATLLRLVRIQQQDTTAARLGMESALTSFLNNMYETSEYMTDMATSVKTSIEDAMSLMSSTDAVSFEYQVQKWLGSMYSVGMSSNGVSTISNALGQIASGKIEGITSGGVGNLIVMAANNAGLNMADILADGLDESTTNQLMQSMVNYLAGLYEEAGDSKVIQQQLASVYGLTAADLKAVTNLSTSVQSIATNGLSYGAAIQQLYSMANSMYDRTSIGEMMSNAFSNFEYSMAAGVASNPATYAIYKIGSLLTGTGADTEFALPMVMGSGSAQTFSIANILKAGAMGAGILQGIGSMISAGGNGGITGAGILNALGVSSGLDTVSRGNGTGLVTAGGASVSVSGQYVGNSSSSDISNKAMTDTTDSANSSTANAVDSSTETKLSTVDNHILEIKSILSAINEGTSTISVDVKNWSYMGSIKTEGM